MTATAGGAPDAASAREEDEREGGDRAAAGAASEATRIAGAKRAGESRGTAAGEREPLGSRTRVLRVTLSQPRIDMSLRRRALAIHPPTASFPTLYGRVRATEQTV